MRMPTGPSFQRHRQLRALGRRQEYDSRTHHISVVIARSSRQRVALFARDVTSSGMNNETNNFYYLSQWIRLPFTVLFRFRFVSAYNSFHDDI